MRGHARTASTVSCGAGGTQAPWLLWEIWEGGDEPAGAQDRQRLLRLRGEGRGEGTRCLLYQPAQRPCTTDIGRLPQQPCTKMPDSKFTMNRSLV